ncbi:hypothetical protein TNCV_4639951 [Trichonephila clavipes]|nr:hypothetical protein TNCV_4639951 [Trichonephila clavipes]
MLQLILQRWKTLNLARIPRNHESILPYSPCARVWREHHDMGHVLLAWKWYPSIPRGFFAMLPVLGKKAVLEWCMEEGLIGSSYVCPKCGKSMGKKERVRKDLELELNEDDIKELIMGHEDELTIEELKEILNEEHKETQRNVSPSEQRKMKEDQCRHLPLKIF